MLSVVSTPMEENTNDNTIGELDEEEERKEHIPWRGMIFMHATKEKKRKQEKMKAK